MKRLWSSALRSSSLSQWLAFAIAALLAALVTLAVARHYGQQSADEALAAQGLATLRLQVSALQAELDKQRAVRFVISRDADIISTLTDPTPAATDRLNTKLATLNTAAGSTVIYLIDANGIALAASNYLDEKSFVGNDYQFRSYFRDAMRDGDSQLFALGTVSRQAGLYVAQRIDGPHGALGVVVVKIEFDRLEALWREDQGVTYAADARGVVLLSSEPSWQFLASKTLNNFQVAALRQSLQYGEAALTPIPVTAADSTGTVAIAMVTTRAGSEPIPMIRVAQSVPSVDWTLTKLIPAGEARRLAATSASAFGLMALLPVLAIAATILGILQRNRRVRVRLTRQRLALEEAVATRTADLRASNAQLTRAMSELSQAQDRSARLRDDLFQSNRLAVLGQITAGVAHEINQPLGAIRAYAENSAVLLEHRDADAAAQNLQAITKLTERIAAITEHLRGFARKGSTVIQPTELHAAIEAALVLVSWRLKRNSVAINYTPGPDTMVLTDQIGLEQIIVNLLQNAIEALVTTADAQISIRVAGQGEMVQLTIADNGPGLDPKIAENLFVPFNTSKAQGLGLGLVISQDLAHSFSGSLSVDATGGTGASFTLSLRRAK